METTPEPGFAAVDHALTSSPRRRLVAGELLRRLDTLTPDAAVRLAAHLLLALDEHDNDQAAGFPDDREARARAMGAAATMLAALAKFLNVHDLAHVWLTLAQAGAAYVDTGLVPPPTGPEEPAEHGDQDGRR